MLLIKTNLKNYWTKNVLEKLRLHVRWTNHGQEVLLEKLTAAQLARIGCTSFRQGYLTWNEEIYTTNPAPSFQNLFNIVLSLPLYPCSDTFPSKLHCSVLAVTHFLHGYTAVPLQCHISFTVTLQCPCSVTFPSRLHCSALAVSHFLHGYSKPNDYPSPCWTAEFFLPTIVFDGFVWISQKRRQIAPFRRLTDWI